MAQAGRRAMIFDIGLRGATDKPGWAHLTTDGRAFERLHDKELARHLPALCPAEGYHRIGTGQVLWAGPKQPADEVRVARLQALWFCERLRGQTHDWPSLR